MSTIKATLADAESDGGAVAPTPSPDVDTHARENSKPAPNQPRGEKVTWLVSRFLASSDCNKQSGMIAESDVERLVEQKYSFSDNIQQQYSDDVFTKIVDRFDAEPHPVHGNFYVWGKRLAEATDQANEQATEELDTIS
jgi:hypothetical protein